MTFEEWKEKHSDLIENVAITFFNYEKGVDTKTCFDELEYLLQRAFRAGRTQWHDLEKNPDDLPNYEVIHYVQTDFGEQAYYDKQRKVWRDINDSIRSIPVAWCELPIFDKE